jgi:outer membrane protein TolC
MRRRSLFLLAAIVVSALYAADPGQIHQLTLKEAVDLALKQNPDVLLARLEEQRAAKSLMIQKDPFYPKVFAGSGAAWSTGYPQTIDGNAPSIVQGRVVMSLYNKPLSLRVAQARENQRGAAIESSAVQDDAVYEVALHFLEVSNATRSLELQTKQAASLKQILDTIQSKIADGRALPVDQRKADLDLAVAKDKSLELQIAQESSELALAATLGFPAGDRVQPTPEERSNLALPESEDAALTAAYQSSKNLKVLESKMQAKQLEVKSYKAEWLPQIDLVAQYALLGHFNYADSVSRFQPNNGQLGASFKLPLLVGPAAKAYASQGEVDLAKLRIQVQQTRSRIQTNLHQAYRDLERAESARDVSKKAVEWAQEELRVLVERFEAGRIPLKDVEEARLVENEKWLAYFANNNLVERARLLVLKSSGTLAAALR